MSTVVKKVFVLGRANSYSVVVLCLQSLFVSLSVAGDVGRASAPDGQRMLVVIRWEYQGLAPRMRLYTADPARRIRLWETRSVRTLAQTPAWRRVDGPVSIKKGSARNFVLVYHNPTNKPVYFFSAPHRMTPAEFTLGFRFRCLCVNHVFEVPAGYYWYRVVRILASRHMRGERLQVVHKLVAVDRQRGQLFSTGRHRPVPR